MGLYAIPPYLLLFLAVAFAAAIACAGQILVHRRFKSAEFVRRNEVAGFIIAVVGTLYAVVLGFMTVVTWEHYQTAQERLASETASVLDAWHDAVELPPAARRVMRAAMLDYAHVMIDDEWPKMRDGGFSLQGDTIIMDATTAIGQLRPGNASEVNAQATEIALLNALHDARQQRLSGSDAALTELQWIVLFIGAIVVVGFCYLFQVESADAHLVMTGAVAVIIATMMVLIFELESPFRSPIGISSSAWSAVISHIEYMDSRPGSMMNMKY
ncbi:MAG TPA: DUF4239 domain-containing protein [Candidatus Eremiobacteraceae bacterium]